MKRSEERILTTHVGSLPRPKELLELSSFLKGQPADRAEYLRRTKVAIAETVREQAAIGLDIINEGEFGKSSWANYILERVSGFELRPPQRRDYKWIGSDRFRFPEELANALPPTMASLPQEVCVGPIRYSDAIIAELIGALTSALKTVRAVEGFMTSVAPASASFDGLNEYYATERDFIFGLAGALHDEYMAIYKAGLVLQVDDAVLANMYDALVSESPKRYREWAELRLEALNHALRDIPEDRIRYHLCFGSWHMPHISDAPLENIVDLVLSVKAGAYSIEAANPRHEHEWRVWEKVKLPPGKILIPGVITHHTGTVEHPRLVADRIIRYAKIVGRENVIAGADCGFAQGEIIARASPNVMWAKFEALVEGAKIASQELWGRKPA
jgi:5-methyltetrahydropteroyltriglutamate--homocysteine methyltransferase